MNITKEQEIELKATYSDQKRAIRKRLSEFRAVPPERYFYELCFCIMTPQSSAYQCYLVARVLEEKKFLNNYFDPEPCLREYCGGYVRFHKTKARRLIELRAIYHIIHPLLVDALHEKKLRDLLVEKINGLGYKEASHFLRNIGRTGVSIIDRHILRNLARLDLIPSQSGSMSRKRYLEIEFIFEQLADCLNIPTAELDLLLWSRETGFVLK